MDSKQVADAAKRIPPNAGKGRPKGSQNKVNAAFKNAVLEVFERNGGTEWMSQWASENETEFFKIAARLIPTEMTGKIEHIRTVRSVTDDELADIATSGSAGTTSAQEIEGQSPSVH